MNSPRPQRRARGLLARAVVVALALVVAPAVGAAPATAADMTKFDAGMIIADSVFYDSRAMTAAQIQSFLDDKGRNCRPAADGTACLKDYRADTWTRASDGRCASTYQGASRETAAQIIAKVAAACGINPQVLLVTLQKEQSLVTRTTAGTASVYQKAMGFGCPDTAPCDAQYYGLFNQLYSAAAQFQRYAQRPTSYAHIAGRVNNVRLHPNATCGTVPVLIQNQATASLYNYTPYTPNAAALAAGYGTGDSCSSYGNRNFWGYFTDWFGATTQRAPIGVVEAASGAGGQVTVSGWTLDPDTSDPIDVHVYVDGVGTAHTAALSRPDVAAAYGRGDRHGYTVTRPATAGSHQVCVYAIDSAGGPNTTLGCHTVTVSNRLPTGNLELVAGTQGGVQVAGWASDPDSTSPTEVHVYVGSTSHVVPADQSRPDVGRRGFSATVPAPAGSQQVCVYAIDTSGGANLNLGCRTVTVIANRPPTGALTSVTTDGANLVVTGWATDPDVTQPIDVRVTVNGSPRTVKADAAGPGANERRAFRLTVPASQGQHEVCAHAVDHLGSSSVALGCRTVSVGPNRAPVGSLELVRADAGGVTVAGWTADPDTSDPIAVHVYVDGRGSAHTASAWRPDVGAHGFGITLPQSAGSHTVCVYAIDSAGGANSTLGCRTVTVTSSLPVGNLETVVGGQQSVTVGGWTFDPDTTAPIAVHVYVDGAGYARTADGWRPDVGAAFGRASNHGFAVTVPAAAGNRNVCVYAIDSAGGPNPVLGCRTVTVRP